MLFGQVELGSNYSNRSKFRTIEKKLWNWNQKRAGYHKESLRESLAAFIFTFASHAISKCLLGILPSFFFVRFVFLNEWITNNKRGDDEVKMKSRKRKKDTRKTSKKRWTEKTNEKENKNMEKTRKKTHNDGRLECVFQHSSAHLIWTT